MTQASHHRHSAMHIHALTSTSLISESANSFLGAPVTSILRDAALAPTTLRVYNKNLDRFLRHIRLSLTSLLTLSPVHIDALLCHFIEHLFRTHGSYDYACQSMFGLIYRCPMLRYHLGEARLRLRGWLKLKTKRSHPPITWELAVLFATLMSTWGRHSEAVAVLVAFDCYLRVGELTRLRYTDVVIPNDPRLGEAHTTMALRLAVTKTGPNQWVALNRPEVASVLCNYLQSFPFLDTDLIFGFSPNSFRTLLRDVAVAFGLGHIPYVPHSFRHGGATCDFLHGSTIEQVQFRGRWEATKSARRYIQTARALLIMVQIPDHLHQTGSLMSKELVLLFRTLWNSVPLSRPAEMGKQARRIRW